MSRAELIRSLSAPAELVEADLVDQLADASAALARLRASTPDDHEPAWARHYSQAQNLYHKALDTLLKFRRAHGAPSSAQPQVPPAPTRPAPAPGPPIAPIELSHLNRQQRRRLEALRRASPERRRQKLASTPPRDDRPYHNPVGPPDQTAPPGLCRVDSGLARAGLSPGGRPWAVDAPR